jgi:NAD(P)H-hydrate epimerase
MLLITTIGIEEAVMKVVTSKEMAHIESLAYEEGSSEEQFMEEAGKGVAEAVHSFCEKRKLVKHIILLCGKGNNAGDAYVAGRYLLKKNYQVFAFQIDDLQECTILTRKNHSNFVNKGGIAQQIKSVEEIIFPNEGAIVDGIFGTGFHGIAKEPYASAIKKANQSGLPIIAIDIPSGLSGNTGIADGPAIHATETLFLGQPKIGFFLQDGWNRVGKLQQVDFGIPKQ